MVLLSFIRNLYPLFHRAVPSVAIRVYHLPFLQKVTFFHLLDKVNRDYTLYYSHLNYR